MYFIFLFLETLLTILVLAFIAMTGYEFLTARGSGKRDECRGAASGDSGEPESSAAPVPDNLRNDSDLPAVSVLIPVCNEVLAVKRLVTAVIEIDYPRDRLEVLVLDDSRDANAREIRSFVLEKSAGAPFLRYLCRESREGYKAGNIAFGIRNSRGSLIAVFDADAVPEKIFLKATVPCFIRDEKLRAASGGTSGVRPLGFLQTAISFSNEPENFITRFLGLEVSHKDSMTAGQNRRDEYASLTGSSCVWRRECIDAAGGLSSQTLTEDVDLCYRAQLLGWRYEYVTGTSTQEELPNTMAAMRVQRHRWAMGLIGNTFLYFRKVLASDFSAGKKLAAILVMSQSFILSGFYLILLGCLPAALAAEHHGVYFNVLCLALLISVILWAVNTMGIGVRKSPAVLKDASGAGERETGGADQGCGDFSGSGERAEEAAGPIERGVLEYFGYVLMYFPLSLYYFMALLENILGIRGSFVPTPKRGSPFVRLPRAGAALLLMECFSLIYSLIALTVSIINASWWTLLYTSLTAAGFALALLLPCFSGRKRRA